ncbi:hypothetical protein AAHA92_17741 [Salvia divinorum]|uniref:Uncharacterized protein n=1 Tax=Salvia divinorum TaxID=28513 RepID=A0ABD1GZS5_SALDI
MSIGEKKIASIFTPKFTIFLSPQFHRSQFCTNGKEPNSRNGLLEPRRHRATAERDYSWQAAERDYSRQALLLATDSDAATTAAMNWFMDGKICGHRSERDCLRRTAAGASFGRRFWPRFWSSGGGTDSSVRI